MKVHCQVLGSGPVKVAFTHGWLSDSHVYMDALKYLDLGRFTVALIDQRGYGGSRAMTGDLDVAELAGDVLDTLTSLGWAQAHLVGHSLGGMVLQRAMLDAPHRILSGLAVTPVAASGFPMDAATFSHFANAASDDAVLEGIFGTLTGNRHAQAVLANWRQQCRVQTTTEAFLKLLKTWTGTDFHRDVKKIDRPVLVMVGAHDLAVGPDYQEKTTLSQLRTARSVTVAAAGHYPMLETPAEFATLLSRYLIEDSPL